MGISLNSSRVVYRLSFVGGSKPDDFFITREELENEFPSPGEQNPFNYIACHARKTNEGIFSTAHKKRQINTRVSIPVENQDSV